MKATRANLPVKVKDHLHDRQSELANPSKSPETRQLDYAKNEIVTVAIPVGENAVVVEIQTANSIACFCVDPS